MDQIFRTQQPGRARKSTGGELLGSKCVKQKRKGIARGFPETEKGGLIVGKILLKQG